MGFSSALQGASSHDAILSRVDAELRLLENMKRCLTARVKADREYAIALNSFVLQSKSVKHLVGPTYGVYVSDSWFLYKSQKFDGQAGVQCGSHVAKSWSVSSIKTDQDVATWLPH
jgi:hypothetical protein